LLRSLYEIQPDFEEEAKAYAGLWSQGKKEGPFFPPHCTVYGTEGKERLVCNQDVMKAKWGTWR
jgi:hypothetical protein